MAENIFEKAKGAAKDAVSSVSEKVISFKDNYIGEEQNEITEDLKDATSSKITEIVDNITESMDLISSSGYEFKGIGVSLGLSPSISLSFHYLREITDDTRNEIMEKAADRKTVKIILKLLFKAGDYFKSVKLGGYELDAVNISLGLSLGMSLTMKKKS
jgi:hypothetical protein